jgi:hypothetical protein
MDFYHIRPKEGRNMSTENVSETKPHPQPELRKRGDGNIYPRKGIWWIRYSFRGKPKRESSHSTKPEDAIKLLNRRLKEVWADRQGLQAFIPKADKVLINQLIDSLENDYKLKRVRSLKSLRSHMKPIRETFGDMRAAALRTDHVDKYISRRLKEDRKAPATINREVQILGRAFRLGVERREILPGPHIRRLREDNARQGFFERAEFEAVVQALPEYLQDFSRFAYLCAWRKGQTASLKWEQWIAMPALRSHRDKSSKTRTLTKSYWRVTWRRSSGGAGPLESTNRERAGHFGICVSPERKTHCRSTKGLGLGV